MMNILIVDDNPGDVKLVSEMLRESTTQLFKVTSTGTIEQGLKLLTDVKFDVVILDINLPDSYGLKGLEMMSYLYPEIPVIMLTSLEDESVATTALKKHAADYLSKGQINTHFLVRSIRYAIERKKIEEELRKSNRTLFALRESSQAMLLATDEHAFLKTVCNIIVEFCGYTMVWIGYAEDDKAKTVRPMAFSGFEKGYLETLKITWADTELGRGPTGTAIRTGKVSSCRNMLTDPKLEPWRKEALKRGFLSSVVLPLLAGGKAFGAITIYSSKADPFLEDEVKLLSELADDLSYGIMVIRTKIAKVKSDEALRESEQKVKALLNATTESIWLMDIKGRILAANAIAARRLGKSIEEILGKVYYDFLFPDVKQSSKAMIEKVTSTGEPVRFEDEHMGMAFDHSLQPIKTPSGQVKEIAIFSHDITEQKRIEKVLRLDKEAFEKLVNERTQELLNAQFELEKSRRLSDIGTLATTVAHELRNPLAAINMAAYNIKRKAKNLNLDSHLSTIEKKVTDSNQIINNLLFYSRIKPPKYEGVDIEELFDECIESSMARYANKKFAIEKKFKAMKGVIFKADPFQLKELFNNILINAIDAVPETIGRIEIAAKVEGDSVIIIVKDNGVGIPKELMKKIFDPFFSTKARGTGIGLAVSDQIVTLHEGKLHIDSEEGKGTSVTISLPKRQRN